MKLQEYVRTESQQHVISNIIQKIWKEVVALLSSCVILKSIDISELPDRKVESLF